MLSLEIIKKYYPKVSEEELREIQEIVYLNDKYNNHRYHGAIGYKVPRKYVNMLQEKKGGQLYVM